MFFAKFYNPLSTQPKKINPSINDKAISALMAKNYEQFINLKTHVDRASLSIQQLRYLGYMPTELEALEEELSNMLANLAQSYANQNPGYAITRASQQALINQWALVKRPLNKNEADSMISLIGQFIEMLTTVLGIGCACVVGASASALGGICLAIGLGLISTFLFVATVYSMYVEARFLGGKQIAEIAGLIKLILDPPPTVPSTDMIFFSSATSRHKLTFSTLSTCMEHLPLAAAWAEGEWGYIRRKGIEFRERVMNDLKENIYLGFYADKPVAMFALMDYTYASELQAATNNLLKTKELMYVYVRKEFRSLGFGRQVIEEAKLKAREANAELILLDTLKPSLNKMYQLNGAKVVCESRLFGYPTDALFITLTNEHSSALSRLHP